METSYSAELDLSTRPPRVRAIVEFVEGDLTRPPLVFPQTGSDESDEALRKEIRERWDRR